MNRRYLGAVVGAILGAVVGATIGGLVGRGIALFGDDTVEIVVPIAFCAVLGYAIGGASGCKGSLDRVGAKRSGLGAGLAFVILLASVPAAFFSGSDTVAIFVAVLLAGLVLAGVVAAAAAGPGRARDVASVPEQRAPKLEVKRQTIAPEQPAESEGSTAARPRRTRPLRAGDSGDTK